MFLMQRPMKSLPTLGIRDYSEVTRVVPLIPSKEGGIVVKKGGFFNMFNNEPIRLGFRSFGEIHLALSVEPTLRGAT